MSDIDWKSHGFEPPTPVPTHSDEALLEDIFDRSLEKKTKYDRQLRLWGWHGQDKIDQCSILLLGATPVGCEVLKNLVLPGIGNVTICDDRKVTARDLGNNFYLTKEDLGKDIAPAVAKVLLELNPDVKGNFVRNNVKKMIDDAPDMFENFNFVIASQLDFHYMAKLNNICKEKKLGLICVRSYGMCGYLRVFGGEHTIIESKLDQPIEDLRMYDPWEDYQRFADLQVLDQMNEKDHSHTPFPVILLQISKRFKEAHGGQLPQNEKEIKEYKEMITKTARKWGIETNFMEAYNKAYLAYRYQEVPEAVLEILGDKMCKEEHITKETPEFWVMMYGVRQFFLNEGKGKVLPLQGKISDFHSDTDRFVRLQSLFRRKHRADVDAVLKYIRALCEKKGIEIPKKTKVSFFCKYVHNLRAIHFKTVEEELDFNKIDKQDLEDLMWEEEKKGSSIYYLCLRAVDMYKEKFGKYPGEELECDFEKESAELATILKDLAHSKLGLSKESLSEELLDKFAAHFTRFGASEIHTISSLVGGVASQELIKIVTQQRLPLDNTWVYNGCECASSSLKL